MSFFTRVTGAGYRWMPHMPVSNFIKSASFPIRLHTVTRPYLLTCVQKTNKTCPVSRKANRGMSYLTSNKPINEGGFTMHKTRRMGLTLLFGVLLGVGSYGYANYSSTPNLSVQINPITSSKINGVDWARLCVKQYPEILWLADEKVRITQEDRATLQGSYSEQLFGKKFIEFDRTIMTLHCLKLILDGSDEAYQQFTQAQPENTKLTRESFEALHRQGLTLQKSRFQGMSELEMAQAMEAALVLGDIGKSEKAREVFKAYGAKAPDHDDFHEEVIQILQKHPELCPTFNLLPQASKQLLTQTANLAHYGHITHIEGGPGMFSKLSRSGIASNFPIFLSFDFFVHTCDVAGALGHVNNQSSLVYTEPSHLAMQGVLESCRVLATPNKTEMDAYNAYLAIRANWLGLNVQDRTDRALTRMGAMLRLFTPEEGAILKKAVLKLSPSMRSQIVEQLDIGDGKELDRTPTYMPAVLVNLANNSQLGTSKEERLSQAVILGLPFIARVLASHKEHLACFEADPAIPLCFNGAAGVAKTNPSALNGEYRIDSEGNVCVSEL